MAEESGIGAVKEMIRALRKEKAEEKDGSKRKILGRRIHRLKKKTRRLSQQARLHAQTAAAAPQAEAHSGSGSSRNDRNSGRDRSSCRGRNPVRGPGGSGIRGRRRRSGTGRGRTCGSR